MNYLFKEKDYRLLHLHGRIWKHTRGYNKSAQEVVGNKNDESFPITAKKPWGNKKRHSTVNFRLALFPTRKMFPRRDARVPREEKEQFILISQTPLILIRLERIIPL